MVVVKSSVSIYIHTSSRSVKSYCAVDGTIVALSTK